MERGQRVRGASFARSMTMRIVLVLVAAGIAAAWVATKRQQSSLRADTERLIRAGAAHAAEMAFDDSALGGLPPPVARYLRLALPSRKPIEEVRLEQVGIVRTDATSGRWMRFEAEHLAVPGAIGFLWNARVRVAPLLHVRVRDSLIEGRGSGQVSLMSAFTVSAAGGTLEMNSGSLHRYLAEAVWYPTALLPGPNLHWSPIDDGRALATLSDGRTTVSLEFRFGDGGEVTGIYTRGRWGTFADGYKQVPWEGHFSGYREWSGVLVPSAGEVGWYIDDEWRPVWKGTITDYRVRMRG